MFIAFFALILVSCENPEGFGGTGSISGTITEYFYSDDYSSQIYQQPAVDEEVFILFGDDNALGDRVNTGMNGEFRFDYLYPGNYQIYYRSKDSTQLPDDGWSELLMVDLDNGEDKDLGELTKVSTLDYDEGSAVIKVVVEYVDFAHEQEVYISRGTHDFIDDRVRTQYDGYFEFSHLIPGTYLVFLYSDDVTRQTEHVVLKYEVSISELDQVVDLGEITIENF
jgi:hypothetical protein